MELDIRTLLFVTAITSLGSALAIFLIHKLRFSAQGTLFWVYGSFTIACSITLLALRGTLPDFVTIVFANTAITYGYSITLSGMRVFIGRSSILKVTLTTPLVMVPILFWYSEVQPSLPVRIILCSIAIVAFSGVTSYELLRETKVADRLAQRFTGCVFAINAAFFLIRILLTIIQLPSGSFLKSGTVTAGLFLWTPVYLLGITVGMTLMISERLQAEIKILKGILPICASCKKIRNDKGYWSQMEAYIRDHTYAEFSHGICPECEKKFHDDD